MGHISAGTNLSPLPPEPKASVDIYLHLRTHFGQQKVLLQKVLHEQDAQALKTRLASGAMEDQLQRAILWATSCMASANAETQQSGREILDIIDTLERFVHAVVKASSFFLACKSLSQYLFVEKLLCLKSAFVAHQ